MIYNLSQQLFNRQFMTACWARGMGIIFPDLLEWKRPVKENYIPAGWTKRIFKCKYCGVDIKGIVKQNDFRPRTCFTCKTLQRAKAGHNFYIRNGNKWR
jgi:hypothetical protein